MPPTAPPPRIRRIGSLNRTGLTQRTAASQRPPARAQACCDSPKIEDDGDGHSVCRNCFTQVSESNIVADLTFQEDSRGAATVQGGFVGENARHARTLGSTAFRRVGGGEKNSAQEIEANGRRALGSLCPRLGLPESIATQALQLYSFAVSYNFSAGRRTDEVIAACLYAACRRQKDNAILLIDIAEIQRLNVFRLGEVYKSFLQELYIDDVGVGTQYLVEVEALVMRYCRRLEFGDATRQVAEDAVRIIRRMKRDWMVTGRHPAGLCGAAIILAARMNNFRRSVREIVYVAKVADMTVAKRVEEFRRTRSAALTVEQFREYGVRIKHQHDPPVVYESQLKKQKLEEKKRKRQAAGDDQDAPITMDDDATIPDSEQSAKSPIPAPDPDVDTRAQRKRRRRNSGQQQSVAASEQEPRRDADGFLIPALPVDPAITGDEQPAKPKRGRPKKQPPVPVVITEEELVTEAELEDDINSALNDEEIVDSRNDLEKAKDEERARAVAEEQKQADAQKNRSRREAEGIAWAGNWGPTSQAEDGAEDLAREFEDDPEVNNCLLTPEEQQVKERIWIKENEDWLRSHHEKEMLKAVGEATGRNEKGKRKNKGAGKKRKKGKMGDGTTLAEATKPIETAADANMAMLEKRAPATFSKYIDYDVLRKLYAPSASSVSANGSRGGSQSPSVSGASPGVGPDGESATSPYRSIAHLQTRAQAPPSPPPTQPQPQPQADAGAAEAFGGDEDEYMQDASEYGSDTGSPRGWGGFGAEDDREDIGEDDYQRALDPASHLDDAFDDEDY